MIHDKASPFYYSHDKALILGQKRAILKVTKLKWVHTSLNKPLFALVYSLSPLSPPPPLFSFFQKPNVFEQEYVKTNNVIPKRASRCDRYDAYLPRGDITGINIRRHFVSKIVTPINNIRQWIICHFNNNWAVVICFW